MLADHPSWSSTSDSVDVVVSPSMSAIVYAETGAISSWKTHLSLSGSQSHQRPAR